MSAYQRCAIKFRGWAVGLAFATLGPYGSGSGIYAKKRHGLNSWKHAAEPTSERLGRNARGARIASHSPMPVVCKARNAWAGPRIAGLGS